MQNISAAWLTTNYTCNCKCDWCYARKMLDKNQHMDFELAKQIIQYLSVNSINNITLIGGEPTIYPDIIELISYIKTKGMMARIATNGKRLKDMSFAKQMIESGIDGINISIKGSSEQEYILNTHRAGMKDAITGYHNLKSLGFDPSVSYVVTSNNHGKFDEFVEMLIKSKLDNVVIQFEKPPLNSHGDTRTMDVRNMGSFAGYIFSVLEEKDINYTIELSFPLCLIEENVLQKMLKKERVSTCCYAQKGTGIVFDIEGKVIPCNHFLGYPFEDSPLNLQNKDSINELMEREVVKQFKETVKRFPSSKCINCDLWTICGGGCFTRWFYIEPKNYIKANV